MLKQTEKGLERSEKNVIVRGAKTNRDDVKINIVRRLQKRVVYSSEAIGNMVRSSWPTHS